MGLQKRRKIINTLNDKSELEIISHDIVGTHRIGEPKKTRGKTCPIIVTFI